MAKSGKLDPIIGRDDEICRYIHIISRRTMNNHVLIGEPGVGKTAISEGLAQRIVQGDVPQDLMNRRLISLDMGSLITGAKYYGEFEDRLKVVLCEVTKSDGQIVLFIDEIHTIVGAGATSGAMDAGNLLKPMLGRRELPYIGATTLDEYHKYIEKDPTLERRFQQVYVDPPSSLGSSRNGSEVNSLETNISKVYAQVSAMLALKETSKVHPEFQIFPVVLQEEMDVLAGQYSEVEETPFV